MGFLNWLSGNSEEKPEDGTNTIANTMEQPPRFWLNDNLHGDEPECLAGGAHSYEEDGKTTINDERVQVFKCTKKPCNARYYQPLSRASG